MERLKGLLRRRPGGDIRSSQSALNFSEMEIVSDPENTEEIRGNNPDRSEQFQQDQDTTYASMMDKIETLTMEKFTLEDRLAYVESQLEAKEKENLELKSKCEDLVTSLELEKRRLHWQQKFYEKRIQQLTGVTNSSSASTTIDNNEDEGVDSESDRLRRCQSMEDLLANNAFYEQTIKALVIVQENQSTEIRNLRTFYEEKLKNLSREHEMEVSEILESQNHQVQKLISENEGLIRDLLTGCEGLFDDLKSEYTVQAKNNVELTTNSGENIIVQFKGLSPLVKGIVVAGITVISVATAGWASWGFVIWVWPRLIAFAEVLAANPETFGYLLAFLNSVPFLNFMKAWEEGKSLGDCLKAFANTEFLSSALRMAPDLFTQFKKFPRPIVN